nr:BRO family protein [Phascolarctobacterium sp.]
MLEGNETVTNCHRLKMQAADGKMRLTDVANTKDILRIIQSIPSPKAEPFKLWLAQVGSDRIAEIENPELAQIKSHPPTQKYSSCISWSIFYEFTLVRSCTASAR